MAADSLVHDSVMDLLLIEMVATVSSADGDRDSAFAKLEAAGYRVGMALIERLVLPARTLVARDRQRFTDNLDIVKFICKDYWLALFNKQIDNLKTNHRGVYVLTDNSFLWLARMSAPVSSETPQLASLHTAFPCGLIRGALANLGMSAIVAADTGNLPQ
ncbi:Trafficking protein particle complex subunit 6B, partial [Entophlyctis luteolus]